jgi:Domain of unknown function (DUF1707)
MVHRHVWDRLAGQDPDLRASDADRDRIAARLRAGHTEGRLDLSEFGERLERCYEAKTLGELDELVLDLPREERRDERRFLQWAGLWRLAPWAPIAIALIVVSASAGYHVFWLWLPLVFLLWRMSWWRRGRWTARGGSGECV